MHGNLYQCRAINRKTKPELWPAQWLGWDSALPSFGQTGCGRWPSPRLPYALEVRLCHPTMPKACHKPSNAWPWASSADSESRPRSLWVPSDRDPRGKALGQSLHSTPVHGREHGEQSDCGDDPALQRRPLHVSGIDEARVCEVDGRDQPWLTHLVQLARLQVGWSPRRSPSTPTRDWSGRLCTSTCRSSRRRGR